MTDTTEDFSGNDSHAIVSEQLETLYRHCEERGISRSETEQKLLCLLQGAMFRSYSFKDSLYGEVLNGPGSAELTKAYNLAMAIGERTPQFKQACQSWLLARCGAKLGDVVIAYGWKQPREILVQDVRLSWGTDAALEEGMVTLEGPTKYSKGVEVRSNCTPIGCDLNKM